MGVMDAILAAIHGAAEERISGRTLLQKKLYFLSVLNQEAFGYRPHYYGPIVSWLQITSEHCARRDSLRKRSRLFLNQ